MIFRLAWYFGMGALAHWLWIGAHVDPTDIFTYVCFLLGPIMCLAWLVAKMFWLGVALIVLGVVGMYVFADHIDRLILRWRRWRKRRQ